MSYADTITLPPNGYKRFIDTGAPACAGVIMNPLAS